MGTLGTSVGLNACGSTSSGGSDLACVAMTSCGYGGLCLDHGVTDGAMRTLRQTRCGASSGNSLVGDNSVTRCGNRFGVAVGTLGASKGFYASGSASGGSSDLGSIAVARCGYGSLCLNDRITDGAVRAFGLTGSGACCGNSLVDYLSVTCRV